MPQPSARTGHIDQLLTNVSVAYMQDQTKFISNQVFPQLPVKEQSGFYYEFPRGWFLRDEVGPRPMGGYPRSVGYELAKQSYYVEEEALEAWLDDRERANATPPHDPEKGKVNLLTQHHLIHSDKKWVDSFFKAGVWGQQHAGVAAAPTGDQFLQWDNVNSTPIEDIDLRRDTIAESTGMDFNVLVLGRRVYRTLKHHPAIMELIKYTQKGVLTKDLLASFFEIEKVLVPSAIHNVGGEVRNATTGEIEVEEDYSFIADPNSALLAYAAAAPGLEVPTAGYIVTWTGLLGGRAFVPSAVNRGRDDRAYSDWFHVRQAFEPKKVSDDLAIFLQTVVDAAA